MQSFWKESSCGLKASLWSKFSFLVDCMEKVQPGGSPSATCLWQSHLEATLWTEAHSLTLVDKQTWETE